MSEFPIGKWRVSVDDGQGTTLEVEFTEAGSLSGSITHEKRTRELTGVWAEYESNASKFDIAAKLSNGTYWIRTLERVGELVCQDAMGMLYHFSKKAEFPVGKWRVQVKDSYNSVMELEFDEFGKFRGTQKIQTLEIDVCGEWMLNKNGNRLDLKGKVGKPSGFVDFELELVRRMERVFVNRTDPFEFLYIFEPMPEQAS